MPLAAIVPQHFELVVEREDIAAQLDDKIARLVVAGEVGDQQPLMHVVGDVHFPVCVSVAARQFFGRSAAFDRAGVPVEDGDVHVCEVPFAGALRMGIDEEAEDFLPSVLVDVADGHWPRAVGRNRCEAAETVRVERGKIPISHRPERLAGERKGP